MGRSFSTRNDEQEHENSSFAQEDGSAPDRPDDDEQDHGRTHKKRRSKKHQSFDPDGTLGIARNSYPEVALPDKDENKADDGGKFNQYVQTTDRGGNVKTKRTRDGRKKDKIVTALVRRHDLKRKTATKAALAASELFQDTAGLLEAEHDMERTTALTQVQLKRLLPAKATLHSYDLKFTSAYGFAYDRSGRWGLLYGKDPGGSNGHVAIMDCHERALQTEFYTNERIRDACFLHNGSLFAAAQSQHVYIYDNRGAEVHQLDQHTDVHALQFLPYHWLLASIGRAGYLKYQDTSTGQMVSQHATKLGLCHVLRQNPSNAVLHAGHANGTVTLWSPASSQPLVKMLCHKGAAIHSLAIDPSGKYMVTGGADRQVKIWDLRTYKNLHSYFTVAGIPTAMDISQRGLLGIGHAGHATIWSAEAVKQKVREPYMHHAMPACGPVETLRFRPFEDVCGIGHAKGISSIIVPGCGEPNIDTSEYNTNPWSDKKQRQEGEVRALLDKLSPNMIGLDDNAIGGVEDEDPHRRLERIHEIEQQALEKSKNKKVKQKTNKRGRSKIQVKLRRKKQNIIDQSIIRLREAREQEKASSAAKRQGEEVDTPKDRAPAALRRFF